MAATGSSPDVGTAESGSAGAHSPRLNRFDHKSVTRMVGRLIAILESGKPVPPS